MRDRACRSGHGVWSLAWGRLLGNLVGAVCVCASQSIDIVLVSSSRQQKSSYAAASPTRHDGGNHRGVQRGLFTIVGSSPAALGYYVLAFNVSGWAISIFSFGIDRVSLPTFARLRDNPETLRLAFIRE